MIDVNSTNPEWDKYADENGSDFVYSETGYIFGASHFQKRAIEDVMKLEDRLYEDSDQTTPKELLWQIIQILEELKP